MPEEIERKFFVFKDRLPELTGGRRMRQGYLAEEPQVRFRIVGDTVVLALKKFVDHGKRFEIEFKREKMNAGEIEVLCSLALWPPLTKTRYDVRHEGLVWEVDVYEGDNEGLVTADVELPRLDHPVVFPDWVDSESEITGDMRYSNITLTRIPYNRTCENTGEE